MEECLCVFSSVLKAEIVDMPVQISEMALLCQVQMYMVGVLKVSQVIWP